MFLVLHMHSNYRDQHINHVYEEIAAVFQPMLGVTFQCPTLLNSCATS